MSTTTRSSRQRVKYLYQIIDERAGQRRPPLLSVSIHHGVVPRSSITEDEPRAEDLSNYKICAKGDIILNRMRAFQGAIGVSELNGLVSPDYLVLRPSSDAEARFLHYLFRSQWFVGEMISRLRGIGSVSQGNVRTPRINPEDFGNIEATIPCIDEQRRVAEFLNDETARIDRVQRAREAQRAVLSERLLATVSESIFPGTLSQQKCDSCWPWLPPVKPDRPLVRLGYVCRLQSGLTVDGSRDVEGDVVTRPYLRVANVQAGRVDLENVAEISVSRSVAARSRLRAGDVLMTEGGDLDKLGRGTVWRGEIEDCLHQNHVFALRPDPSKLDGDYLALITQTLHGRCYFESTGVRTTNLASTNSNKILSFPVPLPELDVQRGLVNKLNNHIGMVDRALEAIDHQTALLRERKRALITAAVTGQVDVTTARGHSA